MNENWGAISPGAWLALLFVIAGPTTAAYLMNAWALRYADSSVVAAYTYVQPVLATILGAIIFGEAIRGIVMFAGVMIFSGVALAGKNPASRNIDALVPPELRGALIAREALHRSRPARDVLHSAG